MTAKAVGRYVVVNRDGDIFVPSEVSLVAFESIKNAQRRVEHATAEYPEGSPYRVVRIQFFEQEAHDSEEAE